MKKILLAGATGYLGSFILRELEKREFEIRTIVRNKSRLNSFDPKRTEVIQAKVTNSENLQQICTGVDTVISTVGITKQKDGLTYMDVDYQANMNLLSEAKRSGARKFIYVSVLNGEKLRHLKCCYAKEKFVDELKVSGLDYCIVRPNGFFSDMTEFYNMAKKGKVYLFGDGLYKANPIHGEDLAKYCVDCIENSEKEFEIGGPEILSQIEIAKMAFEALDKKQKISYISNTLRKIILKLAKTFTSAKTYGPIEFFINVLAMDMIAPQYGKHTLKEYFESLNKRSS